MNTKRIERIQDMEQVLNEWNALAQRSEQLLYALRQAKPALEQLVAYYSSPQWMEDFEAVETGELVPHFPHGVLSEDAVFDLLTSLKGFAEEVREMNLDIARIPYEE